MPLYGQTALQEDFDGLDMDEVLEAFFIDDLKRMDEATLKEFLESDKYKALCEKTVFAKESQPKTSRMRITADADRLRRIRLMCYMIAKQKGDPDFKKMVELRKKWKERRAKVFARYGNQATRLAKIAQKNYIKKVKSEKA